MLIAIGTLDGIKINHEHFGHSKIYMIYEFDGKELIKKEERKNPYAETHLHAKVEEILEILGDCKIWVGKTMGKRSMKKLEELGYKPILINTTNINETLKKLKEKLQR
ncbi:MAG: dinitrogenase iron-molybdenum cofactor biosynthesis protein [Thermosipho sp. (in: Bacteria)]|nr:dinitrogenase iron-molybdenum cofactor biosynthesis protein [Thermosipho sp. (in: thermotogales)]